MPKKFNVTGTCFADKHYMADVSEKLEKTAKKVVLFIDEVDKSSNNQLFVSFLAMLRTKYLNRHRVKTFHLIIFWNVMVVWFFCLL